MYCRYGDVSRIVSGSESQRDRQHVPTQSAYELQEYILLYLMFPVVRCHPCSDGIFVFLFSLLFPFLLGWCVCVFLCVQALFAAAMDKMGIQNTDQVRLQARPSIWLLSGIYFQNCCSFMILAHPFNALCFSFFFCSSSQSIQHDTTYRSWFMAEKETSGLLGFGVCSNCMV